MKGIKLAREGILLVSLLFVSGLISQSLAQSKTSTAYIAYDPQSRVAVLHTVGKGLPPMKRTLSSAQKRLLARRAAVVHGYRNLLQAFDTLPSRSRKGILVEQTSGFIKGVEVGITRHFSDGRVEVDLVLPLSGSVSTFEEVKTFYSTSRLPVCEIEHEKKYISKEEYDELIRQKDK